MMKTRIIICFVLSFLIVTPVIADDISTTEIMKLISGTWVNNEYRDFGQWGKFVLNENGRLDFYFEESDTKTALWGELVIYEVWTDAEGNIWYKSGSYNGGYFEGADQVVFELTKVSNSGSILEYMFSYHEYPTDLDPDHIFYRIYYRQ
jgi:hypothetical protein